MFYILLLHVFGSCQPWNINVHRVVKPSLGPKKKLRILSYTLQKQVLHIDDGNCWQVHDITHDLIVSDHCLKGLVICLCGVYRFFPFYDTNPKPKQMFIRVWVWHKIFLSIYIHIYIMYIMYMCVCTIRIVYVKYIIYNIKM